MTKLRKFLDDPVRFNRYVLLKTLAVILLLLVLSGADTPVVYKGF